MNTALADSTAGYVMQLRQHGQPIASAQVNWAKELRRLRRSHRVDVSGQYLPALHQDGRPVGTNADMNIDYVRVWSA